MTDQKPKPLDPGKRKPGEAVEGAHPGESEGKLNNGEKDRGERDVREPGAVRREERQINR